MSTLESVRSFPTPEPTPSIRLDFAPHKEVYVYTLGETTVEPANTFYAHANETLTFTASITFPTASRYAVGYRWEFGDGGVAYSNPATHVYKQPSTTMLAVFVVTDNKGVEWRASKAMYLK
jgi:hypothetical protein